MNSNDYRVWWTQHKTGLTLRDWSWLVLVMLLVCLLASCATQSAPSKITLQDCPKPPVVQPSSPPPALLGTWSSEWKSLVDDAQTKLSALGLK